MSREYSQRNGRCVAKLSCHARSNVSQWRERGHVVRRQVGGHGLVRVWRKAAHVSRCARRQIRRIRCTLSLRHLCHWCRCRPVQFGWAPLSLSLSTAFTRSALKSAALTAVCCVGLRCAREMPQQAFRFEQVQGVVDRSDRRIGPFSPICGTQGNASALLKLLRALRCAAVTADVVLGAHLESVVRLRPLEQRPPVLLSQPTARRLAQVGQGAVPMSTSTTALTVRSAASPSLACPVSVSLHALESTQSLALRRPPLRNVAVARLLRE